MWKKVIALVCLCRTVYSSPCCNSTENIVQKGQCLDGSNISGIQCPLRFMIEKDEEFFEQVGNQLVLQENIFDHESYCLTKQLIDGKEKEVALICFEDSEQHHPIWFSMVASCEILSVIAILITIIVYCSIGSVLDLQGKCILHSISALGMAMLFLALVQLQIEFSEIYCTIVGYIIFVMFLVSFAWLNVVAFHIWKTVVSLRTPPNLYFFYNLYGYGIPLCMLITALISQNIEGDHIKPNMEGTCFFNGTIAIWTYFYGPMAILLTINVFFYIWTIKSLWKDMNQISDSISRLKYLRCRCLMCVKLFFIMGLMWIFEDLSFAFKNENDVLDSIWLVTDFINALEGVFIFLVLVVFRKKVVRELAKKGGCVVRFPEKWKTLQDDEGESQEENFPDHSTDKAEDKV